MTCLHFFPPPPPFPGAQAEGKCQCKHSCSPAWEIILSSLTAKNLTKRSDGFIRASTSTSPLNPFFPPSLYVIPRFSSQRFSTHSHVRRHTPTPPPSFLRTDANRLLILLVSVGVSFEINLYTSAPKSTLIGLNSFNNHDICLLAYLPSKQAQAQPASWETVTLTFVSVRELKMWLLVQYINCEWNIQFKHTQRRRLTHAEVKHMFIAYRAFLNSSQGHIYTAQAYILEQCRPVL